MKLDQRQRKPDALYCVFLRRNFLYMAHNFGPPCDDHNLKRFQMFGDLPHILDISKFDNGQYPFD